MKKFVSLITVIVLLICVCMPTAASAQNDVYPVVIVPGYSSSQLFYTAEDGTKEHVWGINFDWIGEYVLHNIAKVGAGLGMLAFGKAEYLSKTVGEGAIELMGKLACNGDTTGKYDLSLYYSSARETCSAYLSEMYSDGSFRHEREIMDAVAELVGIENIFNFNCDFRMGSVCCANQLDAYIDDVLAYTGSDRVNIIAVSHGGQVTATYLTLFGHKRAVNNAVLNVPAIGGAGIAYDALKGDFDFDEETLVRFVEHGFISETDYNWLVKAQQLGFLDTVLDGLMPYFYQIIGNWGSIWDFVQSEYYDEMKAKHLDETENAGLIAASDYFHYTVYPQISSCLKRCNDEYGMHVSIIAGTDNPVVSGLDENSDGIIPTVSSTGATVTPFCKRFSDGYTAINGDNAYVSPAMNIDASTAYLPDNTWFVSGLFHGMEYKDSYSAALLFKLLLTDDIENVYSDPAFPRFHATTNASSSVFAAFDCSTEGYLCAEDTALKVTNLSNKYPMKLLAVTCSGMDIGFSIKNSGKLDSGESTSLPFSGNLPQKGSSCVSVTVTYMLVGSPTPVNERTFYFTLKNGNSPVYNQSAPYTPLNANNIDNGMSGVLSRLLGAVGILPLVSILYNIVSFVFESVFAV